MSLNFDNDNQNEEAMARLHCPQRLGFPSWHIVNQKGEVIDSQIPGLLCENGKFNADHIYGYLRMWTVVTTDPKTYKMK